MIYLLFVLTCLLTVRAYYAADRELLAPGVIFAGGFAFSELLPFLNCGPWAS